MESNVAQLSIADRLWAWFEIHKQQVLWAAVAIVVVGVCVGFFFWQQQEKQARANKALSSVTSTGFSGVEQPAAPEPLLKVVADYPNTGAAQRALLLAGAALYAEGKYSEAKAQFDRFLREYRKSPLAAQALLGVAACLDASGKNEEAIPVYNNIVQHYSTQNVAPQAKLALACLYEKEGKWERARELYLDLAKGPFGSISSEAAIHLEALLDKHPELVPARPALATNAPALSLPRP